MPTRRKERGRGIGNGRRREDPKQKLMRELAVTEQHLRTATRNHKKMCRRAQNAGITPQKIELEASVEVRKGEIQFFPGGLSLPDHGHVVVKLAADLSPRCLAELADKLVNGNVTYDRMIGDDHGWWNYRPANDTSMAAD